MHDAEQALINSLVRPKVHLRVRGRSALTRTRPGQVAVRKSDRGLDPGLPKACAVRAVTVSTSVTVATSIRRSHGSSALPWPLISERAQSASKDCGDRNFTKEPANWISAKETPPSLGLDR